MRDRFFSLPAILFLVLILASCAHNIRQPPPGYRSLFPSTFSISQHMLWTAKGKDYDFVCVAKQSPEELRISSFFELGGTVFDFSVHRGSGKFTIHQKPDRMPDFILSEGIGHDLKELYSMYVPADPAQWKSHVTIGRDSKIVFYFSDPAPDGIPRQIVISNHKFDYTLSIEILDDKEAGKTSSCFGSMGFEKKIRARTEYQCERDS